MLTSVFGGSRVVGGRYLLEQRVAAGAMGVVVRATHLQVGSTVAVKLMRPQKEETHIALARFQREAQILGQIKHPNAVLVMDFGIERRGDESVPYLVMEYLRGDSLADVLERKGRLSLEELDRLLAPLCEAVEEAHAVGVIHRDIKPSNVVLEKLRDGSEIVKVLDFGIAKLVARGPAPPLLTPAPVALMPLAGTDSTAEGEDGATHEEIAALVADDGEEAFLEEMVRTQEETPHGNPADRTTLGSPRAAPRDGVAPRAHDASTDAGFMIGTVPYMAPEQMTGARVSRRTDVHALAVVAFQCLAGRLPYDGADDDIIASKLADDRPSLRELGIEVPAGLDELLMRSFALDPLLRPATVKELGDAVRSFAHAARAERDGDSVLSAIVQLSVLSRSLALAARTVCEWVDSDVAVVVAAEEHYGKARDVLLAVDAPLRRVRHAVEQASPPFAEHVRLELAAARTELEARCTDVRRGLARLDAAQATGHGSAELGEYLMALWTRLDVIAQELVDTLGVLTEDEKSDAAAPLFAAELFAPTEAPRQASLAELADRLLHRDPLDSGDALDALLTTFLDAVVRAFGPQRDVDIATRLARGLWRHADTMLLHELTPSRRAFRLLPFLAGLRDLPAAAPFALLARVLGSVTLAEEDARSALASLEKPEDRAVVARCMLVHPHEGTRAIGLAQLGLPDLWSVIAHASTPMAVLRFVFDHVRKTAPSEYLKIFFFCVRENLRAAVAPADVAEALRLLTGFFELAFFHEDVVFEPLLDVERVVRQRAAALGEVHQAYADALAAFTAGGVTETKPLEHMRDVPLPIQRKLAREGHFLTYFISHSNDRVARETLPHLFRLEDITPYLRIATIHRVVLTELAKRRRFFRKEPPKLALLQNPKTPAIVARVFLPLVSQDQLRLLSTNKHINPDVRRLVTIALARAPVA
jgi:serine/threonine protein kinase